MTITISTGKLTDDILNDATIQDDVGRSATWIFTNKKNSQEIEEKIKSFVFDYANDIKISVSINGNDNKGFNGDLSKLKF